MTKCKQRVDELREREHEAVRKIKTTLQIVERMKDEKAQVKIN